MRYLTVALTKGRLANKTMEMFEKAGITCEEMKDKDSRKLIFTNEELKMKFFLAKGPDVPTYVEYGAADIGIVGKDTILEEGRKLSNTEVPSVFKNFPNRFSTRSAAVSIPLYKSVCVRFASNCSADDVFPLFAFNFERS